MPENHRAEKVHYIHRLSSTAQDRIVGIFVVSAVLVVVVLVLLQIQSSHLLDDKIIYHAYLSNAQGVSTETLIHVSGIEVGQVKSIDITPDNRIHVVLFVYESFQRLVRMDSRGALNKLSVIGNAVIIIKAGSHNLPILPADSTIPVEEPVSVDELMARLTPVITSVNDTVQKVSAIVAVIEPDKIKTVAQDLSGLMTNLQNISLQIAEGKGLLGRVIFDKGFEQDITATMQGIVPIVKGTDQIIRDTQKSIQRVDNLLRETELRVKEISQLIKPVAQLVNQSTDIAADVHSTTKVVNSEVRQLPELVNKMQSLLDSTNQTLQNAQQVWPLSVVVPAQNKKTMIREQPLDD